ncbi:TMEM175 family protein [Rathayibacter sp. YIM 133350]|uniref:TMEM175 family protein n=1 Tax=Rathayibacter sp. YIM 133350 TaxID=3131992 RepID=UPI00307F68AB
MPNHADAESPRERYRRILTQGDDTERTVFFSDAVMAIAMTLLVLEIHIPEVKDAEIGRALLEELPVFGAYVLSFGIIGLHWINHNRKFRVIRHYDAGLQWINLAFLFFVALLPVITSALVTNGAAVIVVLYAVNVAALSLLQFWMWSYAWRKGFIDEVVDDEVYLVSRRQQLTTPAVFLLSVPIALFIDPTVAMLFWIILLPVGVVARMLPLSAHAPRRGTAVYTSRED